MLIKTDTALSKKDCTCYEYVRTVARKLQVYLVSDRITAAKYSEIEYKSKGTEQICNNRIKKSKIEIVLCQNIHHQHYL